MQAPKTTNTGRYAVSSHAKYVLGVIWYAQIQFGSHPRLRGDSKYNRTKKIYRRSRMPIPHALGRPDATWKNYDRERTQKEHQMGDKNVLDSDQKCASFWTKSCSHFGAEVGHILDQKWSRFWTKSVPFSGPKVCPFLVQKCVLFWIKSVSFFEPKMVPILDETSNQMSNFGHPHFE